MCGLLCSPESMNPYFLAFLVLPPIMIGVTFMTKKKRLWPIVIAFCVVGWALVCFAIEWNFNTLKNQIDAMTNPPEELIEAWAADGRNEYLVPFLDGFTRSFIFCPGLFRAGLSDGF